MKSYVFFVPPLTGDVQGQRLTYEDLDWLLITPVRGTVQHPLPSPKPSTQYRTLPGEPEVVCLFLAWVPVSLC